MKIQLNPLCPFNLDFTLNCGQVFKWKKQNGWWYGVARDQVFKIRQLGDELQSENVSREFVETYFRLNDDLLRIFSEIRKEKHVNCAINALRGLRILRQHPWECLISYICATYKNIPAVRKMVNSLSKKFGVKIGFDGQIFYTFPDPERLAKATPLELTNCGLGYRAKYVAETARMICENTVALERLKGVPYEEAKQKLVTLPGVGSKVADCVLLFSLEKLEAFPVDVWIKRVILEHYAQHFPNKFIQTISNKKSLTHKEYDKLNQFGRQYFGKYAGYAQEYLYHYERTQQPKRF